MTWLIDTLLVTGVLILAVLILRRPVARWFGPGAAYALWALPLLRLFLPPLTLPAASVAVPVAAPAEVLAFSAAPPQAAAASGYPLTELLIALWLGGALLFLIVRARGYATMRRELLDGARPVGEAAGVRLVESPAASGPVAFGVRDKVIALPWGFMDQSDRTARDLALAHEFEHHAGRDLLVNIAVQPLLALHWFNPLAWLGWRALRRDQEAACDARVLAGRDATARADYGRLIAFYSVAPRQHFAAPLACPILTEKPIIHRLRSLTMTEPSKARRLLGRTLFACTALALPLTATITYAASDAPAAPAAPAATPAAPRAERHVMIIDAPEGATIDDTSLHTRTVVRDGKTIIIKSSEPLDEAEAARRVDEALASVPGMPPMPPMPPMPAEPSLPVEPRAATPPTPPTPPVPPRTTVMIRHGESQTVTTSGVAPRVMMLRRGEPGTPPVAGCDGKVAAQVSAVGGEERERQAVTMRWCGGEATPAQTIVALKKARERMATESRYSPELREEVLKQLDAEIARLSKEG